MPKAKPTERTKPGRSNVLAFVQKPEPEGIPVYLRIGEGAPWCDGERFTEKEVQRIINCLGRIAKDQRRAESAAV